MNAGSKRPLIRRPTPPQKGGRPFFLRGAWIALSLTALAAPACRTLEQLAPPVDPVSIQLASAEGVSADSLHRGRHIYLTTCAKCHSVEPIDKYSAQRWQELLPEMIEESKLDGQRADDVRAYILIARRLISQQLAE